MGHAAATVMESSAELFANGTATAGLIAATTFDLLTEVWRGVALADLVAEGHQGACLAFHGPDNAASVASHGTVTFPHLPREAQTCLQALLCHLGENIPALDERGTAFSATGSNGECSLAIRALPSGFVAIAGQGWPKSGQTRSSAARTGTARLMLRPKGGPAGRRGGGWCARG